jgi:uncharacterized protein
MPKLTPDFIPDVMSKNSQNNELIKFPTSFPIKIMGKRVDGFAQTISELVLQHAPDFDPATMEFRNSKEGNYLGLTATINATSRAQLDGLYMALTKHPMVKIVL